MFGTMSIGPMSFEDRIVERMHLLPDDALARSPLSAEMAHLLDSFEALTEL